MDLLDVGAVELARSLTPGRVADHLVRVLARIEECDKGLNAFSALNPRALDDARALDLLAPLVAARLPLFGVPVAVKEEIDVAGMVTTFGGRGNSSPATADSEVVTRLRAAGAVIVGKTHMPEFGQTAFTTGEWGFTRNPHDLTRSPGGSSGGSAVAVASRMVPLALGGDGGGSVRIPAAWTGIVGLKPTRGRVSTAPQPHLWHDLGTYGPLAREVDDVATALRGLAPTAVRRERPSTLTVGWTLTSPVPGLRPSPEVADAVAGAARRLQVLGHDVHHGSLRWLNPVLPFLVQYHCAVRDEVAALEHPDRAERRSRRVAALGRLIPEAVFEWSQRSARRFEEATNRAFGAFDVLLTPVTPTPPRPIRRVHEMGYFRAHLLSSSVIAHTSYWNLAGNPAVAVPVGRTAAGLPLSVQVIGPCGGDDLVLEVARLLG
ncbi:MAG: amidase family protein [Propionibacteriaceae bacterium]|nr:amidase family protein [Propionibacteriaceae bacterium]